MWALKFRTFWVLRQCLLYWITVLRMLVGTNIATATAAFRLQFWGKRRTMTSKQCLILFAWQYESFIFNIFFPLFFLFKHAFVTSGYLWMFLCRIYGNYLEDSFNAMILITFYVKKNNLWLKSNTSLQTHLVYVFYLSNISKYWWVPLTYSVSEPKQTRKYLPSV